MYHSFKLNKYQHPLKKKSSNTLVTLNKQSFADGFKARCKLFPPFVAWCHYKRENESPISLELLSSPPSLKASDHLQDLVGKLRSPGGHISGGNSPAHRVTGSLALPDPVLIHEVHTLGCRGADRFLSHETWDLG